MSTRTDMRRSLLSITAGVGLSVVLSMAISTTGGANTGDSTTAGYGTGSGAGNTSTSANTAPTAARPDSRRDKNDISAVDSSQIAEIRYPKGAKSLSNEQKREIDEVVSMAQSKGEIDQVKVLAWADREYPRKGVKIPRLERSLASERSKAVRRYLKERHKISEVDTYNMAERPNTLEKLFSTSDYKVKSAAEVRGQAPTAENPDLIRSNGRSSTALVVVQLK